MRKMMFALAASAVASAAGFAADPPRPLVAPIIPCPPVVMPVPCAPGSTLPGYPGGMPGTPGMPNYPGTPGTPGVPGTPGTPGTPEVPNTPNTPTSTPDAGGGGAFARQGEGGTQAAATGAPNMFGDVLGARALRIGFNVPIQARFGLGAPTTTANGNGVFVIPNAANSSGNGDSMSVSASELKNAKNW